MSEQQWTCAARCKKAKKVGSRSKLFKCKRKGRKGKGGQRWSHDHDAVDDGAEDPMEEELEPNRGSVCSKILAKSKGRGEGRSQGLRFFKGKREGRSPGFCAAERKGEGQSQSKGFRLPAKGKAKAKVWPKRNHSQVWPKTPPSLQTQLGRRASLRSSKTGKRPDQQQDTEGPKSAKGRSSKQVKHRAGARSAAGR